MTQGMTDPRCALEQPTTQQAFGELVGISQPAVSDLMARGVIGQGQPAGAWILAYCEHLRQVAAGRDPDGQLAEQRTRLAREQADRLALENTNQRATYLPRSLLQAVLAHVTRQAAVHLGHVPADVLMRHPQFHGEPLRLLEAKLAAARGALLVARLDPDQLEVDEPDAED